MDFSDGHGVVSALVLDLGDAAVDEKLDAGDEAAVVGGEEHGGLGDLLGRADAAERDLAASPSSSLLASWSAASSSLEDGVSIGPGLRALTRILRSFRSDVQVRANERTAALVAL